LPLWDFQWRCSQRLFSKRDSTIVNFMTRTQESEFQWQRQLSCTHQPMNRFFHRICLDIKRTLWGISNLQRRLLFTFRSLIRPCGGELGTLK
jgi:hypothetical protein